MAGLSVCLTPNLLTTAIREMKWAPVGGMTDARNW